MELQDDLYIWLKSLGIVADTEIASCSAASVVLTAAATQLFLSGGRLAPLLRALPGRTRTEESNKALDSLRSDPAARRQNWREISRALLPLGVSVDEGTIDRIDSGEVAAATDVLEKIRLVVQDQPQPLQAGEQSKIRVDSDVVIGENDEVGERIEVLQKEATFGCTPSYALNVDVSKDLGETESCLEFLLVSLCNCFTLTPKQAAGLLADSSRLLARVLARGVNGDFTPVYDWLSTLQENATHLVRLLVSSSEAIPMLLGTVGKGLLSTDREVAVWTCRTISEVCEEIGKESETAQAKAVEWLGEEGVKGLAGMVERHREISAGAAMLARATRGRIGQVATRTLKAAFGDPAVCFEFVMSLLLLLSHQAEETDEELRDVVEFWVKEATKQAENRDNLGARVAAIDLLVGLWDDFREIVEANQDSAKYIHGTIVRAASDQNLALRMFAITQLFRLLETFARDRQPYAPMLYRSLSYILSENHSSAPVREFMMGNFRTFYREQTRTPVDILLDPYAMQMDFSWREVNTFDVEFFRCIVQSPKLGEKSALQILDWCAKAVTNSFLLSQGISKLMLPLLHRLQGQSDLLEDFILRTAKVSPIFHAE